MDAILIKEEQFFKSASAASKILSLFRIMFDAIKNISLQKPMYKKTKKQTAAPCRDKKVKCIF